MEEIETREVSMICPEINDISNDIAIKLIEQQAENCTQYELSEAITREIVQLKAKTFNLLKKIEVQIENFFLADELKIYYPDIIIALSKSIMSEIMKSKRLKMDTMRLDNLQREAIINLKKSINAHTYK